MPSLADIKFQLLDRWSESSNYCCLEKFLLARRICIEDCGHCLNRKELFLRNQLIDMQCIFKNSCTGFNKVVTVHAPQCPV